MRYKINVTFQGTATLELDADSPEAARLAVLELELPDLARQGFADVLTWKIAAREVTPTAALAGEDNAAPEDDAPRKPRPSGWYRPL